MENTPIRYITLGCSTCLKVGRRFGKLYFQSPSFNIKRVVEYGFKKGSWDMVSRKLNVCLLLIVFLLLGACDGDGGSSDSPAGGNENSSEEGGSNNPLSLTDFNNVKLTLSSGTGIIASDLFLYSDGVVDYVLRTSNVNYPSIRRLQWTLEGSSLFVNNGSKKLGDGLSSPMEIQFDSSPSVGDLIRQKTGNSTFSHKVIYDIQAVERIVVKLSKEDFYGKAYEFSPNGSTSYSSLSRLNFTGEETGFRESTRYQREFTWSLISDDTLRLDYSNGDYSEYEFRFGLSSGEHVYTLLELGLGHLLSSETLLVNSYLL